MNEYLNAADYARASCCFFWTAAHFPKNMDRLRRAQMPQRVGNTVVVRGLWDPRPVALQLLQQQQPRLLQPQQPQQRVRQVVAGDDHAIFLSAAGDVFTMGGGVLGQLGIGAVDEVVIRAPVRVRGLPRIKSIAAGEYSSAAVTEQHQLYVWGSFNLSILPSLVMPLHRVHNVAFMAPRHALVVTLGGELYRFTQETVAKVDTPQQVAHVFAGGNAALALYADGTLSGESRRRGVLSVSVSRKRDGEQLLLLDHGHVVTLPSGVSRSWPARAVGVSIDTQSSVVLEDGRAYSDDGGVTQRVVQASQGFDFSALLLLPDQKQPTTQEPTQDLLRGGGKKTRTYALTARFQPYARVVHSILRHQRGWRAYGYVFKRVAAHAKPSILIDLVPQAEMTRRFPDFPQLSVCARTGTETKDQIFINEDRWMHGTTLADFESLHQYRTYVINHEVGHALGADHLECRGCGLDAPLMLQQTLGTKCCTVNPYPTDADYENAMRL
jgi:hypothetical protein